MNRKTFQSRFSVISILVTASMLCSKSISAQVNLSVEAAKMQMAYKNPPSLSFDVKFTYAIETDPGTILDSSMGSFKMSGTYYWGNIDSTEFMQNGSYSIMLYKPDKMMRVSNPSFVYPEIANFSSFDSLVGKSNYTTVCSAMGCNKMITLNFSNPDFAYKSFQISYDSVTNRVTQMISVMKEGFDEYSDSYNRTDTATTNYVIIKATYTNYQTTDFSNTIFSTGNYFMWNGSAYIPQSPYGDYEIFIASPNLLN